MKPRFLLILALVICSDLSYADTFQIRVVDSDTGRGVPLAEVTPLNRPTFVTDSNGVVAVEDPQLLNKTLHFNLQSFGYSDATRAVTTTAGGSVQIAVERQNLAERLYRVTGAGIYRDSVATGASVPIEHPLLNANVLGQDSVQTAVYRDKIYWFWGDTGFQDGGYNFRTSGATSELPGRGGLDPSLGVNLEYFIAPNGNAKGMVPMNEPGLVWVGGLFTLPDNSGQERLLTHFSRVEGDFTLLEHGLALFDDTTETFQRFRQYDLDAPITPNGHAFRHTVDGQQYIYFAGNYPSVRVKADWDHVMDISTWEAYTPLQENSRYSADNPPLDLDDQGDIVFGWKKNTDPLTSDMLNELVSRGHLDRDQSPFRLEDHATGRDIYLHRASVHWNEYRQSWIMIGCEVYGESFLGEIWFSEAPTPEGPWENAVKIITHHRDPDVTYSFYNPTSHPYFDQENGRFIYLEGTYTMWLSTSDETPLYDYNQIMYRLDLAEIPHLFPRLAGDYNGDGTVNAADYTVWRDALGTGDLTADGSGDGIIDAADYDVWKKSFGAFNPSAEANAIPEPATWLMAIWAITAFAHWCLKSCENPT